MRLPEPPQLLHVRAIVKNPCWKATWPRPRHVSQVFTPLLPLGARAAARGAQVEARDDDRSFDAAGGLLERDRQIVAEVLASAGPASAAAAEDVPEAEEVSQNVAEIAEDLLVEAGKTGLPADARVPEPVVALALAGVGKDGVGLRGLFE
jgi:hypothetical protein